MRVLAAVLCLHTYLQVMVRGSWVASPHCYTLTAAALDGAALSMSLGCS
jgi:hypothetical protein